MSVVLRADKSVLAAFRKRADRLGVSDEAVYQKLQCQELSISEALVKDSAERLTPVIAALEARQQPLLEGYRVRILDVSSSFGVVSSSANSAYSICAPYFGSVMICVTRALPDHRFSPSR